MLFINEQDKSISEYLNKIGVKYEPSFTAEMLHDEWPHDLFYTVFKGKAVAGFEYKTGIGHRLSSDSKGFKNALSTSQRKQVRQLREVLGDINPLKPADHVVNKKMIAEWVVLPTQASVLYGLILDSGAEHENFQDWCANYGYDSDSLKALNIYNACLENTKKLYSVFTREQIEHLQELLEDY